ncbi:MAG: proton-conducting transporter membrane subunit [Oligoflexales bacterium]
MNGDFYLHLFQFNFADYHVNFSFVFDILSILMLVMITLIGGVVCQYALSSLASEENKNYFFMHLYGALLSVIFLVVSGNLILFLIFWMAAQFFSHNMMMFYNTRLQARMACWKRNIINLIGDVFIVTSAVFLINNFKSLDFLNLIQAVQNNDASHSGMVIPSILLAVGVILKTVQFPFHFWIVEAMEVPVVVSAVMHAGIINAGGFLLIRMSEVFSDALLMNMILVYSGALSASFGAISMIYQNDIKKKLAYSTVSQMGLMIYACGIGAYSIAMVHILVHSLYKSHTFLSTGSLVKEHKTEVTKTGCFFKNFVLLFSFMYSLFVIYLFYLERLSSDIIYSYVVLLGFAQSFFVNRKSYGVYPSFLIAAMLFLCFLFYLGIDNYILSHASPFVSVSDDKYIVDSFFYIFPSLIIFFFSFYLCVFESNKNSSFSKRMKFFFLNGAYLKNISTRMFLKNIKNEVPYA